MYEIKRRGNRHDVRWRPALVENREERKKAHALGNGAGTQNDFGMGGM